MTLQQLLEVFESFKDLGDDAPIKFIHEKTECELKLGLVYTSGDGVILAYVEDAEAAANVECDDCGRAECNCGADTDNKS